jgi:NAD(P)-dependent dehydrogenase (short-subunit alcohol dehydrogenase family)
MTDRVCIVTGANSGIGKEIARGLAARRAKVVMICRNHIRGETAQQEIQSTTGNANLQLFLCDLSSMASVRAVADQLLQRLPRIDVLVHNAGLINGSRRETTDGLENTFAVNHLAPFLLSGLLLGRLRAAQSARIVNVSSRAHMEGFLDVTDLQMERSYSPWRAYRASKLAQILFTYELARRLPASSGVTVNACHPGWVASNFGRDGGLLTRIGVALTRPLQISNVEGARTPLYLAMSEEVTGITGRYFVDERDARSSPLSYDEQLARRLWEASTRLAGGLSPG